MEHPETLDCACPCGTSRFVVRGAPLIRMICHCTICQAVYRNPFADIVALRIGQVEHPVDPQIQFRKHRPPPNVARGVCPSCDNPVVGFMSIPIFGVAFVPAVNFPGDVELPAPSLHIFYRSRVDDIADTLPKYSGYWSSEWAVSRRILPTMLGG